MDEDYVCKECLTEGVERRFLFFPNHRACRVENGVSRGVEICLICGNTGAKYTVSIVMGSLDRERMLKERTQGSRDK